MPDPLEDVLRLVAEGRLTPAEAAPIISALSDRGTSGLDGRGGAGPAGSTPPPRPGRGPARSADDRPPRLRIAVRDNGRTVVDLQVPGVLAELAASLPGIPAAYTDRVRDALRAGIRGQIVDIRDDGGGGLSIVID